MAGNADPAVRASPTPPARRPPKAAPADHRLHTGNQRRVHRDRRAPEFPQRDLDLRARPGLVRLERDHALFLWSIDRRRIGALLVDLAGGAPLGGEVDVNRGPGLFAARSTRCSDQGSQGQATKASAAWQAAHPPTAKRIASIRATRRTNGLRCGRFQRPWIQAGHRDRTQTEDRT